MSPKASSPITPANTAAKPLTPGPCSTTSRTSGLAFLPFGCERTAFGLCTGVSFSRLWVVQARVSQRY
jgi:hypothetical protein